MASTCCLEACHLYRNNTGSFVYHIHNNGLNITSFSGSQRGFICPSKLILDKFHFSVEGTLVKEQEKPDI